MYRMTAAILANGRKIARRSDGYRCAQPILRAALNPSYGLACDVQAEARALLQVTDHAEEVLGLRIAAWSEHADQALGRRAGRFAKLFKADRRLDVVAQDRLASINITAQHCINAFAKKSLGEFLVGLDPTLHQFLEAFGFAIVRLRSTSSPLVVRTIT